MGKVHIEYPESHPKFLKCSHIIESEFCGIPILNEDDIVMHNQRGIYGSAMLCDDIINCIYDDANTQRYFIDHNNRVYRCYVKHAYCKRCLGCIGCFFSYVPSRMNMYKTGLFQIECLLVD